MQHLLDDFVPVHPGRVESRPVVHLLKQRCVAIISQINVEVRGCGRFDDMVAELDVLRCILGIIRPFEQIADAFFAGFVGQNLIAAVRVSAGACGISFVERDRIGGDRQAGEGRLIADRVVRLVFLGGLFAKIFGFVREDAVECAVKQVRVDGLPFAFPVAQSAVGDLAVLKDAVGGIDGRLVLQVDGLYRDLCGSGTGFCGLFGFRIGLASRQTQHEQTAEHPSERSMFFLHVVLLKNK